MSRLTDAHIEQLDREGFLIIPDFITGDELKRLQEAQRRVLPTWEEVRDKPPQDQAGNSLLSCFPHEEMDLYQATMGEESIAFARKWLKTDAIHMRVGCLIARYPGHQGGGKGSDDSGLHIDNGNNSLLPMSEDLREFGQIGCWIHLEDVAANQAPLRLIPKMHGKDQIGQDHSLSRDAGWIIYKDSNHCLSTVTCSTISVFTPSFKSFSITARELPSMRSKGGAPSRCASSRASRVNRPVVINKPLSALPTIAP
jgi:hypothetical protein